MPDHTRDFLATGPRTATGPQLNSALPATLALLLAAGCSFDYSGGTTVATDNVITAIVLDQEGHPAAGARAKLQRRLDGDWQNAGQGNAMDATTDATGRLRFAPRESAIWTLSVLDTSEETGTIGALWVDSIAGGSELGNLNLLQSRRLAVVRPPDLDSATLCWLVWAHGAIAYPLGSDTLWVDGVPEGLWSLQLLTSGSGQMADLAPLASGTLAVTPQDSLILEFIGAGVDSLTPQWDPASVDSTLLDSIGTSSNAPISSSVGINGSSGLSQASLSELMNSSAWQVSSSVIDTIAP
jgi:hypothetical protein